MDVGKKFNILLHVFVSLILCVNMAYLGVFLLSYFKFIEYHMSVHLVTFASYDVFIVVLVMVQMMFIGAMANVIVKEDQATTLELIRTLNKITFQIVSGQFDKVMDDH